MKKRGFTLPELLGVIVILAIIIGVVGMSAVSIVNKSKNQLQKEIEENLHDAAVTYAIENKNTTTVLVKTLVDKGYFEDKKTYCNRNASITLKRTSTGYDAVLPNNVCQV